METAFRVDLGRVAYEPALALQRALVEKRADGGIPDVLLLLEHDPVVTLGRRSAGEARTLLPGVPTVAVERGGDLTYHAPGQLVGYPIFLLPEDRRDIGGHLRGLEEALIRALRGYGLAALRDPPHTGVWCAGKKLASIGVAVRRWVTFHGFALNVTIDLAPFRRLNPCGLPGEVMGSMAEALGRPVDLADAADRVAREIGAVFGKDLVRVERARLGL